MATVLIHAGMAKTGSTSVQEWLRRHAVAIREHHGLTLVRDRGGVFDKSQGLEVYERGPFVISNRFLIAYYGGLRHAAEPAALSSLCAEWVDELDAAANEHGDIIISAEGFTQPVVENRTDFLTALEHLSRRHTVRFVYYVRPQHDALESRWRQWGYHHGDKPASWVKSQLPDLLYAQQLFEAERTAPGVQFVVRPFRRDLLTGSDVVADFAHHIVGAPDLVSEEIAANPGLSLDLAILLHGAPSEVTSTPMDMRIDGVENGRRQVTLAAVTSGWDLPVSDRAQQARAALHAIAHAEFETDNASLIKRQGWPTDSFIPPTDTIADIGSLDSLLTPSVDPTTLAYLHRTIAELCTAHEKRDAT